MKEINGYDLSRNWFNYCFENPENIKPVHTALYFFCIEHCNRLGWKSKFGLPTTMVMEAIGVKSYNTYINTLNDIIEYGFINMIEKSKNQYSSNVIALSIFNKAQYKALDKALIKHTSKQSESTVQSIDSIIKQLTKNKEQLTKNHISLLKDIIETPNTDKIKEIEFNIFWDVFHKTTGKPKTDRDATIKYWDRLTKSDKRKAFDSIDSFSKTQDDNTYLKKCRTYISEKTFNDEFEPVKPKNDLLDNLRELNATPQAKDYTKYINAIGLSIRDGELNHYLAMKQDATVQQMKDVCIAAYNSSSSELAVLNALKRENKPEITNFKIALLNIIKYYKN